MNVYEHGPFNFYSFIYSFIHALTISIHLYSAVAYTHSVFSQLYSELRDVSTEINKNNNLDHFMHFSVETKVSSLSVPQVNFEMKSKI